MSTPCFKKGNYASPLNPPVCIALLALLLFSFNSERRDDLRRIPREEDNVTAAGVCETVGSPPLLTLTRWLAGCCCCEWPLRLTLLGPWDGAAGLPVWRYCSANLQLRAVTECTFWPSLILGGIFRELSNKLFF